jgi:hypothetical protein
MTDAAIPFTDPFLRDPGPRRLVSRKPGRRDGQGLDPSAFLAAAIGAPVLACIALSGLTLGAGLFLFGPGVVLGAPAYLLLGLPAYALAIRRWGGRMRPLWFVTLLAGFVANLASPVLVSLGGFLLGMTGGDLAGVATLFLVMGLIQGSANSIAFGLVYGWRVRPHQPTP